MSWKLSLRLVFNILILLVISSFIFSCGGGGGGVFIPPGGGGTVAKAGVDRDVATGDTVNLDGSASTSASGDPLFYVWGVDSKPPGSSIYLYDSYTEIPYFVPNVDGEYVISLTVYDGLDSSTDTIIITATSPPTPPNANAGPDQHVLADPATIVTLDGTGSYDVNSADVLSYAWTIINQPSGSSAILSGADTNSPTFTAEIDGMYDIGLVVSDGTFNSAEDVVTVFAHLHISPISHDVEDAEYSEQLDRIVMVSTTPSNSLHIYDPVNEADTAIDLPGVPSSVSVSPDGLYSAVGFSNGAVAMFNSTTGEELGFYKPSSLKINDIILGGNGFIYLTPDDYTSLYCLNTVDGSVLAHTNTMGHREKRTVKLHPLRPEIYGARWGVTPIDMEKFSISKGVARFLYDSPYHGDYDMWGNFWISRDGTRIYNNAGTIFNSSSVKADDFIYNSRLTELGTLVIRAMGESPADGTLALVTATNYTDWDADIYLRYFDPATNALLDQVILPSFLMPGETFLGRGRYVFHNSDGSRLYVVLSGHDSLYTEHFGVVVY
jgi:hypothetical protein